MMTTMLLAAVLMFPTVHGRTVTARDYVLPTELSGKANVVMVEFKADQQFEVDTWLPVVQDLATEQPDLRYNEVKVFSFKQKVDGRHYQYGVTDPALYENTVCLREGPWHFKRALHLPTSGTIYTLVLDKQGYVRWRTAGAMTPLKAQELREAVAQLENQS
jgi:hypothetical protein